MPSSPPPMAAWNLALRFALELAALAGLVVGAWHLVEGPLRWPLGIAAPLLAATVWGTFNVPDDPSRSGNAPRPVSGPTRLALELIVLAAGFGGFAIADLTGAAVALGAATVIHYAVAWRRVRWLLAG